MKKSVLIDQLLVRLNWSTEEFTLLENIGFLIFVKHFLKFAITFLRGIFSIWILYLEPFKL